MFLKYILIISTFLLSSQSESKDHYTVEKVKDSKYVGNVYKIEKPVVYIENLSQCNYLDKYVALNTSCLFVEKSQYKIEEVSHNCTGCLSKETMPIPLRVSLKESVELTVVAEYSASINYLSYRFFGGNRPHKILLLKDENGNYVESASYNFDSDFSLLSNKASRESNKIMAIKAIPYIVYQICFYEQQPLDSEENKRKIEKMLSDFKLSNSIQVSDSTCNRKGVLKKGVVLTSKNFDDFLTFYYFKGEWEIYGKMD